VKFFLVIYLLARYRYRYHDNFQIIVTISYQNRKSDIDPSLIKTTKRSDGSQTELSEGLIPSETPNPRNQRITTRKPCFPTPNWSTRRLHDANRTLKDPIIR